MSISGGGHGNGFPDGTRESIYKLDQGRCFYCGGILRKEPKIKSQYGTQLILEGNNYEADHLIPGDNHHIDNGVASCRTCNSKKSNLTHRKFIEQYGGKTMSEQPPGGKFSVLEKYVRCHAITLEGTRCRNSAAENTQSLCHCHR